MKKYSWILFVVTGAIIGQFIAEAADRVANSSGVQHILLATLASIAFLPLCLLAAAAVMKPTGKR